MKGKYLFIWPILLFIWLAISFLHNVKYQHAKQPSNYYTTTWEDERTRLRISFRAGYVKATLNNSGRMNNWKRDSIEFETWFVHRFYPDSAWVDSLK